MDLDLDPDLDLDLDLDLDPDLDLIWTCSWEQHMIKSPPVSSECLQLLFRMKSGTKETETGRSETLDRARRSVLLSFGSVCCFLSP